MSHQFELALRQYIAAFDGKNGTSSDEFKTLFDNLFHQDFTFLTKGCEYFKSSSQKPYTREQIYRREASKLAKGIKVDLVHFRKIGLNCRDIKLRMTYGEEDYTARIAATFNANMQAIIFREIDESSEIKKNLISSPTTKVVEASCASVIFKFKEFGEKLRTWSTTGDDDSIEEDYDEVVRQAKSMNRRLPRCILIEVVAEDDEDVPSLQEEEDEEHEEEEEEEEEEAALVLPESFDMSNKEVISSYHQFAEAWRLTVILVIVSCLVGMSLTTGHYAGSLFIENR